MQKQSGRRRLLIAAAAVLAVLLIAAAIWFFRPDEPPAPDPEAPAPVSQTEPEALPANPIDFAALRAENPDICGWITAPNTRVDDPILQSSEPDDDFYLTHGADKAVNINGALYIQRLNDPMFRDRNTVIYGHNMINGSMFHTLLQFRDAAFFAANEYFTVYIPHHILTYRIFSAYRYDDRHILNSFDFSDTEEYRIYLESALNPDSPVRNVREGVTVTTDDRIVTLSTCTDDGSGRYLVQGVLIRDEITS